MVRAFYLLLFFVAVLNLDLQAQELFDSYQYRSVGPERGGRVTTVAGTVKESGTFYLGATGGGVWKTTDYGTSWKNVSDGYFATPSIGAIAMSQSNSDIVYVGTGSDGIRSNVIAGKGMYGTTDGGKTWQFLGLENTGQIGAVEIDPNNDQIIYVAAIGQAFQPNQERGIYKSSDGGKSWSNIKFISDKTGFTDLELFPDNSKEILAAAWEVERKPWTIKSGGYEGGIFKSDDGGKSWRQVKKGLPSGLIGKVDLAISASSPNIVYALVEAEEGKRGIYRSNDRGESFQFVSGKPELTTRPFYYTNVNVDPKNPEVVYVMATSYFKSVNGGKSWKRMSSPHGDNHDMWINPENPDLFIQANDGGANVTFNGGKTWSTQFNQTTAEIYQVEVDDQYPYWLYGGQQDNYSTVSVPSNAPYGVQAPDRAYIINTGGCETGPAVPKPGNPDIVYANCKGRFSVYHKPSGTERRYDVGASNMYGHNPNDLRFRFQRVSPIHVSPHNPDVVYHGSQYVHKTIDDGETWEIISPDLTAFEPDKQVISGSPLTRDITGEEFYSTIYSIRESTVKEGVIWVGANDGPVHVTKDGGKSWTKVTPEGMPTGGRVDAVEPSPHDEAKAFVAILRYQLGDWKPYIYRTKDSGSSWELITKGIPADFPVRVIREDPEQPGLLFAGTEYGMFVSFNDGEEWMPFQQNLPVTPITDIKIHRGDLVLSTMGRGFWVLDNIYSLKDFSTAEVNETKLLPIAKTIRYRNPKVRKDRNAYVQYPNPGLIIDYQLKEKVDSPLKLEIVNSKGDIVTTIVGKSSDKQLKKEVVQSMSLNQVYYIDDSRLTTKKGINRYVWNFRHNGTLFPKISKANRNGPLIVPGQYTVRLTVAGKAYEQTTEIAPDPRVMESGVTMDDLEKQETLALQVVDLMSEASMLESKLKDKRTAYSGKKKLSKTEKEIESAWEQLVTKEGTYQQPMLKDQISYLYYIITAADQLPGKDAYDRYDELKGQLEELQSRKWLASK
ncbi:MAG: hypothetical protein AAFQ94_25885 [Bacteroidota bacterium]